MLEPSLQLAAATPFPFILIHRSHIPFPIIYMTNVQTQRRELKLINHSYSLFGESVSSGTFPTDDKTIERNAHKLQSSKLLGHIFHSQESFGVSVERTECIGL